MDQVIIFSDQVNSTVLTLANSFADLKKEVLLITVSPEAVKGSSSAFDSLSGRPDLSTESLNNVEVWHYFKTWSFFEVVKLLPRLLLKKPQTVQFFCSSADSQKTFLWLQRIWSQKSDCVVATSFLSSQIVSENPSFVKNSLPLSDVVTVPNLMSLQQMRGWPAKLRQMKTVLPPFLSVPAKKRTHRMQQSWGIESNFLLFYFSAQCLQEDYWSKLTPLLKTTEIFIWLNKSHFDLWQKKALLSLIEELGLTKKVHALYLTDHELIEFGLDNQSHNLGLVLAHQDFHAEELTHLIEMSIEMHSPLILNEVQSAQYSQLFNHGENSWVISRKDWFESLRQLMKLKGDDFRLSKPLQKNSDIQNKLIDTFFNDLSRIYARAQQLKS